MPITNRQKSTLFIVCVCARNANHLVYYMTAIHTNKLLLNGWFKIIAVVNLKV